MNETQSGTRTRSRKRRPLKARRFGYSLLRGGMYALAAVFLVLFVNKVWHPYGLRRKLEKDVDQTRVQLQSVQQDNARQKRRIHYLGTPQGVASQARRLGYHFEGEHPLRIQESAPPPAPAKAGSGK